MSVLEGGLGGVLGVDGAWLPLPTRPQRYCDPASLVFSFLRTIDPEGNLHFTSIEESDAMNGQAYYCNAYNPEMRAQEIGEKTVRVKKM